MQKTHDYVEEIILQIEPDWVERYIEAEASIMAEPLSQQDGFREWEIIVSDSNPGEVSSIYYWESENAYRAIDQEWLKGLKEKLSTVIPHQYSRFVAAVHSENTRYRVRHLLPETYDE